MPTKPLHKHAHQSDNTRSWSTATLKRFAIYCRRATMPIAVGLLLLIYYNFMSAVSTGHQEELPNWPSKAADDTITPLDTPRRKLDEESERLDSEDVVAQTVQLIQEQFGSGHGLGVSVNMSIWEASGQRLAMDIRARYEHSRKLVYKPMFEGAQRQRSTTGPSIMGNGTHWLHGAVHCHHNASDSQDTNASLLCFRHIKYLSECRPLSYLPSAAAIESHDACRQLCADWNVGLERSNGTWCGGVIYRKRNVTTCQLLDGQSLRRQSRGGMDESAEDAFTARLGSVSSPFVNKHRFSSIFVYLTLESLKDLGVSDPVLMARRASNAHTHILVSMLATTANIPKRIMPNLMTWLHPYHALLFFDPLSEGEGEAIKAMLKPFLSTATNPTQHLKGYLEDGQVSNGQSVADARWQRGVWSRRLSLPSDTSETLMYPQGYKHCIFLKRPPSSEIETAPPATRNKKAVGGGWKPAVIVRYLALLPKALHFPWYAIIDDDTFWIDWNLRVVLANLFVPVEMEDGDEDEVEGSPSESLLLPLYKSLLKKSLRQRHRWLEASAAEDSNSSQSQRISYVRKSLGYMPTVLGYRMKWGSRTKWGRSRIPFIHGGAGIFINDAGARLIGNELVTDACYQRCSWAPHGDVRLGCCAYLLGSSRVAVVPAVGFERDSPIYIRNRTDFDGPTVDLPLTNHRISDTVDFAAFIDETLEGVIGDDAPSMVGSHVGPQQPFPFITTRWIYDMYLDRGSDPMGTPV